VAQKIPDNRSMMATLQKLKAYNAYKVRQLQNAGDGPPPAQAALQTVETWAADKADDGEAWARRREAEANRAIEEGAYWREQVRKDEEKAEQEAQFRSQMDMDQVKTDLKQKLDDYQDAIRQQAKDGHAWAKKQLVKTMQETDEARKFIDEGLEKAMDLTAEKGAQTRRKRRLIAEKMEEQAAEAREWKEQYNDQPARWPEGQRNDVQDALDVINEWAERKSADLKPLGSAAARQVEALADVQSWCSTLKPEVTAQGKALAKAKELGASGAAHTRAVMAGIEGFEAKLERQANDNLEMFRRWTDRNNALARAWIKSDNPKHRQWAEEWLKTQED
jgi:hypothetical protein